MTRLPRTTRAPNAALGLALGLSLASLAGLAHAQVEPRDVSVARAEFRAGVEAARARDWETAREHFARSYEINPRLSALFNLAGAQTQTGALVAAAESYREYLGRRDEASESNVEEARRLLAELERRIPTLRLRVEGRTESDVVTLDDARLNPLLLDGPIPLDPGAHRVAVTREGAEILAESVEAAEGARLELALVAPPLPTTTDAVAFPEDVAAESVAAEDLAAEDLAAEDLATGDTAGRVAVVDAPDPGRSAQVTTTPPEAASENVLEQWWLWAIVGAVVVGAAVAIGVGATSGPSAAPESRGFQMVVPLEVP